MSHQTVSGGSQFFCMMHELYIFGLIMESALGSEIDTQSSPLLSPILGQSGQLDSYAYNVSITHLSPNSVEVLWNCRGQNSHDKYEVTLKPLEARYNYIFLF